MSTHKGIFKNSEIETLSSKLKFIGKIKIGQKISVETQSIQENTYWTSMSRSLSGESRNKVYNYISDVIQDSLSILDSLSNSSNEYDIKVCKNLITDLINLEPGIQNLQETYEVDKMYVAKLQTLAENLEVKLKELCDKRTISYQELYEVCLERRKSEEESSSSGEEPQAEAEAEAEPKDQIIQLDAETEVENTVEDENEVEAEPTSHNQAEAEPQELSKKKDDQSDVATKNYCQDVQLESEKVMVEVRDTPRQNPSDGYLMISDNRQVKSKKKRKKHAYQYDSYYMSSPDDITLCATDLEKGSERGLIN